MELIKAYRFKSMSYIANQLKIGIVAIILYAVTNFMYYVFSYYEKKYGKH